MKEKEKFDIAVWIIVIASLILVIFNIYRIEYSKYDYGLEIKKEGDLGKELDEIIASMDEERRREILDIVSFYNIYLEHRDEYDREIEKIDYEIVNGIKGHELGNINEIKEIVIERIRISEKFKSEIQGIKNVPEILTEFYDNEIKAIDNYIEAYKEINSYYSSKNYSTYSDYEVNSLIEEARKNDNENREYIEGLINNYLD